MKRQPTIDLFSSYQTSLLLAEVKVSCTHLAGRVTAQSTTGLGGHAPAN